MKPSLLTAALLVALCVAAVAEPVPLIGVHAHNDYLHARPLLDALDHGFCSVEADILLVDGKLLVAHTRSSVKPDRTLQALYLDPLRERMKRNGGRVFRDGPEFTLLIDLKSNWRTIYPALRTVLTNYADMLTTFPGEATQTNAVRVILSGNRSRDMLDGESVRYAAMDGTLADLDSGLPASLIPWISAPWSAKFEWRGDGPMPEAEQKRLAEIVAKAHQQGRRVRFWGAPDRPAFWRELNSAGVDLINTDDLSGLEKFLRTGTLPSP